MDNELNFKFLEVLKEWKKDGNVLSAEGRKLIPEIYKTILSITTILIGFDLIFLQIRISSLTFNEKIIFLVGFISLVISTTFGIWAMFGFERKVSKSGKDTILMAKDLADYIKETGMKEGKLPKDIKDRIHWGEDIIVWQLYPQGIFLAVGLMISVLFIYMLLLD